MVEMESEDFLELVWGSTTAWVDLPAKVGDYWVPWHHQWEGEADGVITRRIDSCLHDGESLYFSVCTFSRRGRRDEDALPTRWLWADLDEVHPAELTKIAILPTIAWESSPGRFQALWRLDRAISPRTHRKLNQALSYHCGADHSGWDLTQVLRLPGTRNFKYPGGPTVRLLWHHSELSYRAKYIWSVVGASLPVGLVPAGDVVSDTKADVRPMPQRVRALLSVQPGDVVEGERSSKLWLIECSLAEVGWGEDTIYAAVVDSAWNKWAGLGTGERRLRDEIRKALHHVARKAALGRQPDTVDTSASHRGGDVGSTPPQEGVGGEGDDETVTAPSLPWVAYSSFMAMEMPEPKWLIEDIWTAQSHGIFGGEPKTSKTTLSLALALSVASGRPFLGRYAVHTPGPVLFVQEENAPWMIQDRLRKIAAMYGLIQPLRVSEAAPGALGSTVVELDFPSDVPLRLLNNFGLDLTSEEHREALWAHCEELSPALVVIDPMYLVLAGVDYDRARDLAPYLKWILALRNTVGCAVMLVHHFSKTPNGGSGGGGGVRRHGQRLLGSTTFHGFLDSGLYAEQVVVDDSPGWVGCRLEREFRSMAPQGALDIELRLGEVGALDMECKVGVWNLQGAIEDIVVRTPGITANQVADVLSIDKRTVLGRARDSTVIGVLTGKQGRGHSHRLYPKDDLPSNDT